MRTPRPSRRWFVCTSKTLAPFRRLTKSPAMTVWLLAKLFLPSWITPPLSLAPNDPWMSDPFPTWPWLRTRNANCPPSGGQGSDVLVVLVVVVVVVLDVVVVEDELVVVVVEVTHVARQLPFALSGGGAVGSHTSLPFLTPSPQ